MVNRNNTVKIDYTPTVKDRLKMNYVDNFCYTLIPKVKHTFQKVNKGKRSQELT